MQQCQRCKKNLPTTSFHARGDGLQKWCRDCRSAYRKSNPGNTKASDKRYYEAKGRKNLRLKKYGIDEAQFDALYEEQNGKCAICSEEIAKTSCHVDHDHETGHVRGLLCGPCNRGLGQFRDSEEILNNAIRYIKTFRDPAREFNKITRQERINQCL